MNKIQFRVLHREFLLRLFDVELLSTHARGDASALLGQISVLIVLVGLVFVAPVVVFDAKMPPATFLIASMSVQHFLISTTMLLVGLLAVFSWHSTFPEKRDILILSPLPLPTRTIFLAKISAIGSALGIAVLLLHSLAGLAWPFVLNKRMPAHPFPALTTDPALPPVDVAKLPAVLDQDFRPLLSQNGILARGTGGGLAIGVYEHGMRRVMTYGTALPDSLFETGSIGKTFTALLLARMVEKGSVRFDEPLRLLLPEDTVEKPVGEEIRLIDLATHHSGLPPMPNNLHPEDDAAQQYADYHAADLYAYLSNRGVHKRKDAPYDYSNLGFAVLGKALAHRAGLSYAELVQREVIAPLGLRDTVISPLIEQRSRFIQGYNEDHHPAQPFDLDVFNSAGGFRSTAGDLLTYLVAHLHPEATGLAPALEDSHKLRADATPADRIALAWFYHPQDGTYWHDGATPGFTSAALFNLQQDYAIAVLLNSGPSVTDTLKSIAQHIRQRLLGRPAISLASVNVPANGGFIGLIRAFVVYWVTMFAASAFIFCCVLGLQGLAAQLPRRYFLRLSPLLQSAVLCVVVGTYFLQPTWATPETLVSAQSNGLLSWSPSFWFLGFYQQLSGCPELAMSARRAWLALAIALSLTALAYALSYFRTLRKIVEEPDILPGAHRTLCLPSFAASPQSTIVLFSIRTLLRSRPHRMILAFYLGIALAITILLVKSPSANTASWHDIGTPLLASTALVMIFAVVGTRVAFSLPVDLPANWIFRTAPLGAGSACRSGYRRSLWTLAVAPVWFTSAALLLGLWPWRMALAHLLLIACLAAGLVEFFLPGNQKIPFACAWLPGRSNFHIAFVICALLLSQLTVRGAEWEKIALLQRPAQIYMLSLAFCVFATCARLRAYLASRSELTSSLEFEAAPSWQTVSLNLPKDGGVSR